MSRELTQYHKHVEQAFDIASVGKIGNFLGSGFHADVHEFHPHPDSGICQDKQWVAKLPSPNLQKMKNLRKLKLGYTYGQELKNSHQILAEANKIGIAIPYPEMYILGDDYTPTVIQQRLHGEHPKIYDDNFSEVFEQVINWNQQLKTEFDAEIDLYHFAMNICVHGKSQNTELDGFMYADQNDCVPTLVDFHLIKTYESDPAYIKLLKQTASLFDQKVIQAMWQID
ncbi:hypothetical protein BH09PAT2_BH09PAT2_07230 [soil metagenome]